MMNHDVKMTCDNFELDLFYNPNLVGFLTYLFVGLCYSANQMQRAKKLTISSLQVHLHDVHIILTIDYQYRDLY